MSVAKPYRLIVCLLWWGSGAWAQSGKNPCDLNQDGIVNQTDIVLAVNMALGVASCTATVQSGVCNVVLVQRVANAAAGGACLTDTPVSHVVSLSWVPSTSSGVAGYNVYRASAATGQYTKINSSLVTGTSFSDSGVTAGQIYYYVATAVDSSNLESDYSNVAQAVIPSP